MHDRGSALADSWTCTPLVLTRLSEPATCSLYACWCGPVSTKHGLLTVHCSGCDTFTAACAYALIVCMLLPAFCRCALCLQGSVWGSGSAGTLCAICALATGNAVFWQVIYSLHTAASLPKKVMHQLQLEIAILSKGSSLEVQSSCPRKYVAHIIGQCCMLLSYCPTAETYLASALLTYTHAKNICLQVGFAASFVSKFSDTVSSEVGKVLVCTSCMSRSASIAFADFIWPDCQEMCAGCALPHAEMYHSSELMIGLNSCDCWH